MIIDPHCALIAITGPTAVGKTSTAIQIAQQLSAEILSADSRQFYAEMKIGTARPSNEELAQVPHHFVGHLSIHDPYNVSKFENDALSLLNKLFTTHKYALLVGGSGLYINAVCHGIDELPDPDLKLRADLKKLYHEEGIQALLSKLRELDFDYYREVDRANPNRLLRALEVCITTGIPFSQLRKKTKKKREFKIVKIGLMLPREELNIRIGQRVDEMISNGLLNEVEELYPNRHLNALNTVGYKELFDFLEKKCSLDEAIEKIKTNTRRFAKRQMTWFRKDAEINWFHPGDVEGMIRRVRG